MPLRHPQFVLLATSLAACSASSPTVAPPPAAPEPEIPAGPYAPVQWDLSL